MRRRAGLRRGFTLFELMVYLALVSTALAVLGEIEVAAQHSTALQQGLLGIEGQADVFLSRARDDVEAARSLEVHPDRLRVVRLDGTAVVYAKGSRSEFTAAGALRGVDTFPLIESLRVDRTPSGGVALTARFACTLGAPGDRVTRTYRRVATPRREVAR